MRFTVLSTPCNDYAADNACIDIYKSTRLPGWVISYWAATIMASISLDKVTAIMGASLESYKCGDRKEIEDFCYDIYAAISQIVHLQTDGSKRAWFMTWDTCVASSIQKFLEGICVKRSVDGTSLVRDDAQSCLDLITKWNQTFATRDTNTPKSDVEQAYSVMTEKKAFRRALGKHVPPTIADIITRIAYMRGPCIVPITENNVLRIDEKSPTNVCGKEVTNVLRRVIVVLEKPSPVELVMATGGEYETVQVHPDDSTRLIQLLADKVDMGIIPGSEYDINLATLHERSSSVHYSMVNVSSKDITICRPFERFSTTDMRNAKKPVGFVKEIDLRVQTTKSEEGTKTSVRVYMAPLNDTLTPGKTCNAIECSARGSDIEPHRYIDSEW